MRIVFALSIFILKYGFFNFNLILLKISSISDLLTAFKAGSFLLIVLDFGNGRMKLIFS